MRDNHAVRLPEPLRLFLVLSAGVWFASLAYIEYWIRYHPAPSALPTLFFGWSFSDLMFFQAKLATIGTLAFFRLGTAWIYPAPCAWLYQLLMQPGLWTHHAKATIGTFVLLSLGAACLLTLGLFRKLVREGLPATRAGLFTGSTLLMAYPMWFSLKQGNIESLLWIIVAFGFIAMEEQWWWTAALLIGFAGSFKLYPLIFLLFVLLAKRYVQAAAGFLLFLGLSWLSLWHLGPTAAIALHETVAGVGSFKLLGFYPGVVDRDYLTFDHAWVSLVRVLSHDCSWLMVLLGKIWMPVLGASCALLFLLRVIRMPMANQYLFLILCTVSLPPKSYDYTLQMLYIPLAMLAVIAVRATHAQVQVRGLAFTFAVLALVCSPMFFFPFGDAFYFGQVRAALLVVLFAACCCYSFPSLAGREKDRLRGASRQPER